MSRYQILDKKAPEDSDTLRSGPVSCPGNGVETVVMSVKTRNGYIAYLRSRAYFINAAASPAAQFRVYIGGAIANIREAIRNTQLGLIGNPADEDPPIELPPNVNFEIRFFNPDATTYTDIESDGLITYHRAKPF